MATKNKTNETVISEDGKRYAKKPAGSAFGSANPYSAVSIKSCIKCGKHRDVRLMEGVKIAGRHYLKCIGGCEK
jgi:hypothetical protein